MDGIPCCVEERVPQLHHERLRRLLLEVLERVGPPLPGRAVEDAECILREELDREMHRAPETFIRQLDELLWQSPDRPMA